MNELIRGFYCKNEKCGKLLFGFISNEEMVGKADFRQGTESNYYLCQHCGAKNIAVNKGGDPPSMIITHAE